MLIRQCITNDHERATIDKLNQPNKNKQTNKLSNVISGKGAYYSLRDKVTLGSINRSCNGSDQRLHLKASDESVRPSCK